MAENKTVPSSKSVTAFLNTIKDREVRTDCNTLIAMMESIAKLKPVMWGSAIVGFGTYHYVYDSGREGDMVIVGFSPRKQYIALYLKGGLSPIEGELAKLGTYTTGKGCLYIKSLKDVDTAVLKKLLTKVYRNA
jgi:hypothetical protein